MREEMRRLDRCRNRRDTLERPLEVSRPVELDGLSDLLLPVPDGGEFIWAKIDDRGVIQGPVDGIPGVHHDTQNRRLPRLGNGGLAAGDRETSGRVLCHHRAFKYRQKRLGWLDADGELRAPDTGNGKGRLHLQTLRATTEEMCGAPEHIDHARTFFLRGLDGDRS